MRKFLACIVLILLFFVWDINNVKAEANVIFPEATGGQISEAIAKTTKIRLLPDNPFYFLISVKEFVARTFQPSSARRAEFDFVLSSKRLKEAYLLSDQNNEFDSSLQNYSNRIDKMLSQIVKAREQNQNLQPVLDEMTDGFGYQEVLFFAISVKLNDLNKSDKSFDNAGLSFIRAVDYIDTFRPGFKNRFKSAINYTILKNKSAPASQIPTEVDHFETTASANPKRIIY